MKRGITGAKTPCGRQSKLETLKHHNHQNFVQRFFWSKFESSNKILVRGGWFAEVKASKPARRLAKPLGKIKKQPNSYNLLPYI